MHGQKSKQIVEKEWHYFIILRNLGEICCKLTNLVHSLCPGTRFTAKCYSNTLCEESSTKNFRLWLFCTDLVSGKQSHKKIEILKLSCKNLFLILAELQYCMINYQIQ